MARKSREIVIYVTAPDEELAGSIALRLVEAKLAACVNVVSPIRSVYRWEKKVCDDREVLLIVKTKAQLFQKVERMVKRLHRYETPEVIALPIMSGSRAYMKWLRASTLK